MPLSSDEIRQFGDELYHSFVSRVAIEPLTDRAPDITVEEAYHIQQRVIERHLATGDRVIGKKIGLTSHVVQKALGVSHPDFGQLLASMAVGDTIEAASMLQPRTEGEIAFLLAETLQGPGITNADVIRATRAVMPCFEIVDSRIRNWKIRLQDTVADNGSSAKFALGDRAVDIRDVDLSTCGMVLEKNGIIESTGAGAAALGSPINCVTWLANALWKLGIPLRAGEIILSGALGAMLPAAAGDVFTLSIGGIGNATVRFT